MRKTVGISISMPPELLKEVDHLVKEEERSRSQIICRAFRFYLQTKRKQAMPVETAAVRRERVTEKL